jgi:hypothetical protein
MKSGVGEIDLIVRPFTLEHAAGQFGMRANAT